MNELGVENADLESLSNYYWLLRESFDFPVIGNPEEYVIDPHYFFDSNFHLNDAGAIYRTKLFADDIYRDVWNIAKNSSISIPAQPPYPDIVIGEDSESVKYFELQENETGFTLLRVKDDYINEPSISVPKYFNGKVINTLGSNCFINCKNLSRIILPRTITAIENGAFANLYNLKEAVILYNDPSKILVDYTGRLLDGALDDFKILIPESGYTSYCVDYYWGSYIGSFKTYKDGIYDA